MQLLEELKQELEYLIEALTIYMQEFVSKMKISKYSSQIRELGEVNLLNFNYTNTYNVVYGDVCKHQVHGSVEKQDIVLGVSDKAFNNLDYVYFQKYFQRIQKKTGSDYKSWLPKELTSLEDVPIKVFIMGHSLGATDKEILKDFFMGLYVSEITIFYHNQIAFEGQVISLIDLFGKDFVIEQTGNGRIKFVELKEAMDEKTP